MFFSVYPSRVNRNKDYKCLSPYQFDAELSRCLQCQKKPCSIGCPCNCNPKDFIKAARGGRKSDIDLAALIMYSKTPSSSTCGTLCSTDFCMYRCSRMKIDSIPVNITAVQAEIARRAHIDNNGEFLKLITKKESTGKSVAVIGAGPSGLACAACLASRGHKVDIYERNSSPGGDINYIPQFRKPSYKDKSVSTVDLDVKFTLSCGDVTIKYNTEFPIPNSETGKLSSEAENLAKQYNAVCWCVGEQIDKKLDIPGGEKAINGRQFLKLSPDDVKNKNIMVIGCGAVAIDCAIFAAKYGAKIARIIYRRTLKEAPLSSDEYGLITSFGISVIPLTVVTSLETNDQNNKITMNTIQVSLPDLKNVEGTEQKWKDVDYVVFAIGQKSELPSIFIKNICENNKDESNFQFIGGTHDFSGPMLAVEACASGKNAAMQIDAFLNNKPIPEIDNQKKSNYPVFEINLLPSKLDVSVSFDGKNSIQIPNPFIAAASPFTDSFNAVEHLLKDGWAGVVINVSPSPHHIQNYLRKPKENYSDYINDRLYRPGYNFVGELDAENVKEIVNNLRKEYPNRLFIASLDSSSPTFEKDIQTLNNCQLNAIQVSSNGKPIQVHSNHPILSNISIEQSETENSQFAVVDLIRHFPSNKAVVLDENVQSMHRLLPVRKEKLQGGFAVCGGIKNDSDALFYLSNGAQFVEVDPSSLENNGLEIEMMKAMMSHFIHSQKFSSLYEFLNANASISDLDIEDIQTLDSLTNKSEERLICKLTNPYVCLGCGRCIVCPNDAIDLEPAKWKYVVDPDKCVGCGLCVSKCPTEAISLVKRDENEDSH